MFLEDIKLTHILHRSATLFMLTFKRKYSQLNAIPSVHILNYTIVLIVNKL